MSAPQALLLVGTARGSCFFAGLCQQPDVRPIHLLLPSVGKQSVWDCFEGLGAWNDAMIAGFSQRLAVLR